LPRTLEPVTFRMLQPACSIYPTLAEALTNAFGPPMRYAEFFSWRLGPGARVHIHCRPEHCDLWLSRPGSLSPEHLRTVLKKDEIGVAIQALRPFASGE
jgi:hypothetical protein